MKSDTPVLQDIWGIALAGGKSSRMGVNKAFLKLPGNITFLNNTLNLLSAFVSDCFISCADKSDYSGYPTIPDIISSQGPAGGILSCLKKASENDKTAIIALACDLPLISNHLIHKLILAHQTAENDPLLTAWHNPKSGYLEMTCAIYSVRALEYFQRALDNGTLALRHIIPENRINSIMPGLEERELFLNCNTEKDYKKLLKQF